MTGIITKVLQTKETSKRQHKRMDTQVLKSWPVSFSVLLFVLQVDVIVMCHLTAEPGYLGPHNQLLPGIG